jgi:hypothetical protein
LMRTLMLCFCHQTQHLLSNLWIRVSLQRSKVTISR